MAALFPFKLEIHSQQMIVTHKKKLHTKALLSFISILHFVVVADVVVLSLEQDVECILLYYVDLAHTQIF